MRAGDRIGLIGLILSLVSIIILIIVILYSDITNDIPLFNYISFGFLGVAFISSIIGVAIDHSLLGKIGAALSGIIFIVIIIFLLI